MTRTGSEAARSGGADGGEGTARERGKRPSAAEARTRAQAASRVAAVERRARVAEAFAGREEAGRTLVLASWAGTAVFAISATAAAATGAGPAEAVAFVVALTLAAVGVVGFPWAFLVAVGRSREEEIALGGLVGLAGCAPRRVRWLLLGSLGVEVVVALATAAARPFSSLAFGTLVPLYGLAMVALWAARHGDFPKRVR